MRKKIEWKFEELDKFTKRAKVMGGWILHHESNALLEKNNKFSVVKSESMVFIPDRDHEWTIVQPVDESKPAANKVSATDFESPKD